MSINSGVIVLVISNRPRATRTADLKWLARLLPELYSTQSYYHYKSSNLQNIFLYRSTYAVPYVCMQLKSLQYMGDPFQGQFTVSEQGIRSPVSHDRIEGSRVELAKVTCFWKSLPLTRFWILIGSQAQVFSRIIALSEKLEVSLLSLAKSIYY